MTKQFFLFCLIFLSVTSFCQNNRDCKRVLKKKLELKEFLTQTDDFFEEFNKNFEIVLLCQFDSLDYQIFMGPNGEKSRVFVSELMLLLMEKNNQDFFTYRDLLDALIEFKKSEEYLQIRKMQEAWFLISDKCASVQNWNSDKDFLLQTGLTEKQLDEIFEIVKDNENKKYEEILSIYFSNSKPQNFVDPEFPEGLTVYNDYEVGLQESRLTKKYALVYFNSYGCINAREMEKDILSNPEICNYINDSLILINLYTDDKTELNKTESVFSELQNKKLRTVGDKNLEIEIKYYETNMQPVFVLLKPTGEVISRIGYVLDSEKFKKFLYKR